MPAPGGRGGGAEAPHGRADADPRRTGRKTQARPCVAPGGARRTLANVPVVVLTFEIEGRQVVFEHVYGPLHLERYKVGQGGRRRGSTLTTQTRSAPGR